MHHRSGSWVKGHYRNGTWVSGHNRNEAWVKHQSIRNIDNSNYSLSGIYTPQSFDQEYNFLKSFFRLESSPFIKDIKYQYIDNKIKKVFFSHFIHLVKKKRERINSYDFMSYLENYIIDNIENELLEIKNIENFYTKLKDILQIIYILILGEIDPYYKITYTPSTDTIALNSFEEITKIIKNTIQENKVILSKYYNQSDWEYQRNKFFNSKVKDKIYNPKIALHVLFKKICEENLTKEVE